ncbi:MAG: DEAD/DEAH box helicase, partial [Gammaproteobacteria bacterium]
EIYSIVQFLDPSIFGPLFQFNRDFYALDERGRPVGYKNLDELHRRLRPLMLRRRKDEVEDQLPGRTVNTYFVAMAPEQATRYEEYETRVARLIAQAKRRPLLREEMEKLQKWLACMRMLCDTPYILDRDCRVAPKIDELKNVLDELLEGGDPKLIVFSEWERMLELVRVICEERDLSYAWHTGSTPQEKRRKEIRRFKDDPGCRLFLSTDAGSVGLNLQAANVVINLDLPWNPAKLEQRIARAWRKHQKRQVQVINLVTEHSIEHRMLSLLDQKRTLAAGVVDGRGEVREMTLPSGRAAFMERLQNLVGQTVASAAHAAPARRDGRPEDQLREDALARWRERLDLLEVHRSDAKPPTVIAVCDRVDDAVRQSITETVGEHLGSQSPGVEILDRATYEIIQRLAATGVLTLHTGAAETLHRGASLAQDHRHDRHRRISEARKRFEEAT